MTIRIRDEIRDLAPRIVAWRRDIHANPELAFEEVRTAALASAHLASLGCDVRTGVAKTGVVGVLRGTAAAEGPRRCVALRADMDALPILEENPLDFRSTVSGKMHACGHDGHTAILMGVAEILARKRAELPGDVKFVFQPAEEGPGGALPMLSEGAFENPGVDAVFGLHLWLSEPTGAIRTSPGPMMASVDRFRIVVRGQGGHGAMPHETVDALTAGCAVVTAIQSIVSRNIDPVHPAVITIGTFHAGSGPNVVAETARLEGTFRCFNETLRAFIRRRIAEVSERTAAAYGATAVVELEPLYPATINDERAARLALAAAADVSDDTGPVHLTLAAEDMSYFLNAAPGAYAFVGAASAEKRITEPHHSPRFTIDETALSVGTEYLVRCVERFFSQGL